MELKLIDNSLSIPKEYYFSESNYLITYLYESAHSHFAIKISPKFDDSIYQTELENFVDEIKEKPVLEAQLILNGEIKKVANVAFERYVFTHHDNVFGSQVTTEDIFLECL